MFNNDYELLTYIMNEIKIYEEVFNEVYETAIKLKAYSGRKNTTRRNDWLCSRKEFY